MLTVVTTLTKSHSAELEDVSCSGARLRGSDLPAEGEDVVLRFERVQVFATVVWSSGDVCGLAFDGDLAPDIVEDLQRFGSAATAVGLSPDETAALQAWYLGISR